MTSLKIALGQSETYIYCEVSEFDLQQWLAAGLSPDDLATAALAKNGSLFYREWDDSATVNYRMDGVRTLQYWQGNQELAERQEFGKAA